MAKKDKLIKSKSIYTIKNRHTKTKDGVIYENDYATIIPNDGIYNDEVPLFSESNFKYKIRSEKNNKKKHIRGVFIKPENDGEVFWTLKDIKDTEKTDESKIILKPNYSSLKDFAYYGSAVELIKATVNSIVSNFPGGLIYYKDAPKVYIYDLNDDDRNKKDNYVEYNVVSNEFEIDCWSIGDIEENIKNPMRVIMASYKNYEYYLNDGSKIELPKPHIELYGITCPNEIIGHVIFGEIEEIEKDEKTVKTGKDGKSDTLYIYSGNEGKKYLITKKPRVGKTIIRPKQDIINKYWSTLDDFERVLLNRESTPVYKAIFETPYSNDSGFYYNSRPYIWPTVNNDGFTPDTTSIAFQSYINSLITVATFHDEYDSDNIWRMMTHESIKNLDWTFTSKKDGVESDLSEFDTTGIGAMMRIYGRQFDDIKRYADNIKATNSISYDEKNNLPDYFLTDAVETYGWEAYNVANFNNTTLDAITSGNVVHTTAGKTNAYVNSVFMRNLALSSPYLSRIKGTRRGLEAILNMFGYEYDENCFTVSGKPGTFKIDEYVYIAKNHLMYADAKELRVKGEYAYDDNTTNCMDGYPVLPVIIGDHIDDDGTYLIPWFDKNKEYRNSFYFQSKGGWGKRYKKTIKNNAELTGKESVQLTEKEKEQNIQLSVSVGLYGETQPYMRFASTIDEMLSIEQSELFTDIVCYVTDISNFDDVYIKKDDNEGTPTNYFILKSVALSSFCGYVNNNLYSCYGWKNVSEELFKTNENGDFINDDENEAQRVLYLESLVSNEKGNNPHTGYGLYDSGKDYLERFEKLFKHAFDEGLYDYLKKSDNETYVSAQTYGFSIEEKIDNAKCAYFKDAYAIGSNKTTSINGEDESTISWNCNINKLSFNPENFPKTISGITYDDSDIYDESRANGIINVKKLEISFNTSGNTFLREYFENVVTKYLEEMVPSTTILSYKFDEKSEPAKIDNKILGGTYKTVHPAHVFVESANTENITYWIDSFDLTKK